MKQTLRVLSASILSLITSAAFASNVMPMHLVNNTGLEDARIYFVIKAMDPATDKDCLMHVDKDNGTAECRTVKFGDDLSAFSYTLAEVKDIPIPKIYSGRMYFSIDYPIELYINQDDKILSPDGFKLRDVNYYKIYDKIEFTYNDGGSWINPTAVDFFGFPIRIEQDNQHGSELKASGFYEPRQSIIDTLDSVVTEFDNTDSDEWQKLFITFHEESNKAAPTMLRFMSPGKAMIDGVNPPHYFDEHYLKDANTYDLDYIDAVWEYYQHNTLKVDARELEAFLPDLGSYMFSGRVEDDQFVFTNDDQNPTHIEYIDKPTSSLPFFAGAGGEFDHVNNTPKAIIVRQMTSAFEVGLLPAPDNTVISKEYFVSKKEAGLYYQDNELLNAPGTGPWYDVYAKALHSFDGEQYIYTFAYDDALGHDGTLHDPEASAVTVTLGNLDGLVVPNPYDDDSRYNVNVIIPDETTVIYKDQDGNYHVLSNLDTLSEVPSPLHLSVNNNVADVYLKYPIVTPHYEGADGIVINDLGNNEVEIIFPSPPEA